MSEQYRQLSASASHFAATGMIVLIVVIFAIFQFNAQFLASTTNTERFRVAKELFSATLMRQQVAESRHEFLACILADNPRIFFPSNLTAQSSALVSDLGEGLRMISYRVSQYSPMCHPEFPAPYVGENPEITSWYLSYAEFFLQVSRSISPALLHSSEIDHQIVYQLVKRELSGLFPEYSLSDASKLLDASDLAISLMDLESYEDQRLFAEFVIDAQWPSWGGSSRSFIAGSEYSLYLKYQETDQDLTSVFLKNKYLASLPNFPSRERLAEMINESLPSMFEDSKGNDFDVPFVDVKMSAAAITVSAALAIFFLYSAFFSYTQRAYESSLQQSIENRISFFPLMFSSIDPLSGPPKPMEFFDRNLTWFLFALAPLAILSVGFLCRFMFVDKSYPGSISSLFLPFGNNLLSVPIDLTCLLALTMLLRQVSETFDADSVRTGSFPFDALLVCGNIFVLAMGYLTPLFYRLLNKDFYLPTGLNLAGEIIGSALFVWYFAVWIYFCIPRVNKGSWRAINAYSAVIHSAIITGLAWGA